MKSKKADKPVDVYFVVDGHKIQLTPRQIKHLRRAVSKYDWSVDKRNKYSPLILKLKKLGWVGKSINRKPKVQHPERIREKGCEICNKPENRKKDNIVIHYIIKSTEERGTNARTNLMGLCIECHLSLHNRIVEELRKQSLGGDG